MVVCDMPFLSYQISPEDAVRNCGRVMKETGCHAIKLEGGQPMAATVRRLVDVGIPVMGHLGLTPQSVHAMGGYRVQGRNDQDAERLMIEAESMEKAGAFAIVLEGIPSEVARRITDALEVPTIGIGAGPHCDAQVLVITDLLGLSDRKPAKFVKRYANLGEEIMNAVTRFKEEVAAGVFPDEEHSYH